MGLACALMTGVLKCLGFICTFICEEIICSFLIIYELPWEKLIIKCSSSLS